MNIKDLRKKNADELKDMLTEKNQALAKFSFGMSGSKTKDTKAGKNLRREIAQIMTIARESHKA